MKNNKKSKKNKVLEVSNVTNISTIFKSMYFSEFLTKVNGSKLLIGISLLLINVGSKYVEMNFSKTQEEALRNGLGRELLIFAMLFMGTRDIIISIVMTASFIILSDYLFNENCKYCILPKSMKKIHSLIDKNNDGIISPQEEKNALDILKKAEEQKKHQQQIEFNNFLK